MFIRIGVRSDLVRGKGIVGKVSLYKVINKKTDIVKRHQAIIAKSHNNICFN